MTRRNPFDEERKAYATAYARARDSLRQAVTSGGPYNSTRLSPDEEALAYAFPERLFPGQPVLREQARMMLKQQMGAAEYAAFIRRNAGRERLG